MYYHITVEVAHGSSTGTGRWGEHGDMQPADGRSGKPPFRTLGAEAERLAKVSRNADRVVRIKTSDTDRE